jgi:hypothetical protein
MALIIASPATRRWLHQLACSWRDRRGATSLMFAATIIPFLALVGLGAEGGAWYLAKRSGQNSADAAATAGALAVFWGNYPSICQSGVTSSAKLSAAQASGADVASRDGYSTGVTINNPPASGAYTANYCAVEALISQTQPAMFAGLVGHSGNIAIGNRSVVALTNVGQACVLALTAGISMGGNSTTTGTGCTLASNNTGSQSIYIYGNPSVTAQSLYTVGGCSGCTNSGVNLTQAPQTNQALPIGNPFAGADQAITGYNFSSCQNAPGGSNFSLSPYGTTHAAYCGLHVTNGTGTVTLTPGTYFFTGDVTIDGGTVTCPTCTGGAGVTIVLTDLNGSSTFASMTINGGATVNLSAPTTNSDNSAFNGILFYQDDRATQGGSTIKINGNTGDTFNGGMYFPSATVQANGTASSSTTCTELVAYAVDASGTSDSYFDTSGCQNYGTKVAYIQAPRMLE